MNLGDYRVARERMVREQLMAKGITDPRVLEAMLGVPRHLFLDPDIGPQAYSDHSFPIGYSQTISQPYMVAYLAESLELAGKERVLEVGTGSGYQAAVVASIAKHVCSIERIADLANRAESALRKLAITNVDLRIGDGAAGWPEKGPFDRILLTAAAAEVPDSLLMQLRVGGFLLGPVMKSAGEQEIIKLVRRGTNFELVRLKECSFVPLVRDGGGQSSVPDSPNVS